MTSSGNNRETPPTFQELEISIFGPGFGECLVLHFGNGDWGVVDSCLDPICKRPAALEYLEALQIDVSKSVRFVLATHVHDDHLQGINFVFQAAKLAMFICSGAVRQPDFDGILSLWNGMRFVPGGSGIDELHGVLSELKKRAKGTNFLSPILASSGKVLWERTLQPLASIKALSPSDTALLAAMARLKDFTPRHGKMRRRIPDIRPNDASVVLTAQVGEHRVLLGADLEARGDEGMGWTAIVNEANTKNSKHHGFKVPHHGSPTAHHDEVWKQMLTPEPWAATTPFVKGKTNLPSVGDCRRILGWTRNAYLTAPPHPAKFRDPNRTVEKTINETARWVHFIPGKYGQVRIRKNITATANSPWNVELFGNATTMDNYIKQMNS